MRLLEKTEREMGVLGVGRHFYPIPARATTDPDPDLQPDPFGQITHVTRHSREKPSLPRTLLPPLLGPSSPAPPPTYPNRRSPSLHPFTPLPPIPLPRGGLKVTTTGSDSEYILTELVSSSYQYLTALHY